MDTFAPEHLAALPHLSQDLLEQYYGIVNLLERNKSQPFDDKPKLKLPFILVKVASKLERLVRKV